MSSLIWLVYALCMQQSHFKENFYFQYFVQLLIIEDQFDDLSNMKDFVKILTFWSRKMNLTIGDLD